MINSSAYLRQVGIPEEKFTLLLERLKQEIDQDLHNNKIKKRGIKSTIMTTELKLLLTLRYLRDYPTFINLGAMFGISESYANKVFHQIINYMLRFIHPKKINELSLDDVCTVVIDVTEQEIERPVRKQQSYYSGKKNDIP
jgi:hypothetical protein